MPELCHREAKQEVTFSVLPEMGTWCGSQVWSQPRRSPRELQEAEVPAGSEPAGDSCALLRTLLQQLQKLQTLVTNKISRPYKMAATQTGTCLMVGGILSPQGHMRTHLPQAGFQSGRSEL